MSEIRNIWVLDPKPYAETSESVKSFLDFMESHDGVHVMLPVPISKIPMQYAIGAVKQLGYNIEVTEVSEPDKAFGSIKGKDWHRTNKYRWAIVYWDENGTMISLTHSDNNNDHNFFDSEELAYRNAIDYIVENYKKLEE